MKSSEKDDKKLIQILKDYKKVLVQIRAEQQVLIKEYKKLSVKK